MTSSTSITIRFALPDAKLAPFVTTFYRLEVARDAGEPPLEDYLHPEWANLRIVDEEFCEHAIGDAALEATPRLAVTGPTSLATRFRMRTGKSWGIGLLPLGWAKFFDAPAGDYADRAVDGSIEPGMEHLANLANELSDCSAGFDEELAIIRSHFASMLARPLKDEQAITAINTALVDCEVTRVSELAERAGLSVRSLERLSRRAFGFTPKLLLRRQRFLRSLAQFMLDPTLSWMSTLDYQYHDQAHFIRDFRRFMGMSPSAYAALDHPFLRAAAQARAAIAGEAVQGLHDPASRTA